MALVLCARCGLPVYLPPGYAGSLCSCGRGNHPPAPVGAPSPAFSGAPSGFEGTGTVRTGRPDGGGRAGDSASGSPGRGFEKGPQRPQGGQGKPIEPLQIAEADKTAPVSRSDSELAEAWMAQHFFKKGGITDQDYQKIVGAMKAYEMLRNGEKWRDTFKERWEAGGEARAGVIRVLKTAHLIKSEAQELPGLSGKIAAFLKANEAGMFTLDDLKAKVDPKLTQADLDAVVDAGKAYEPVLGKWRAT